MSVKSEAEWRRHWKPDLCSCPWKSITVNSNTYLIKMKIDSSDYEIILTDFSNFWFESLGGDPLKARIKELNPNLEAPVSKILDQINFTLDKSSRDALLSVSWKPTECGEEKIFVLKISSTLAAMPFVWHFTLSPADNTVARDHLTIPLVLMVSELIRQQKELFSLLSAKDKEIQDLKSQGIQTSRKYLETPNFNNIIFKNQMLTSKGFEEQIKDVQTAFDTEGQELYHQIAVKQAWLKFRVETGCTRNEMLDGENITVSKQGVVESGPSWCDRLPSSLVQCKGSSPSFRPFCNPEISPAKDISPDNESMRNSQVKVTELMRREALDRKLQEEQIQKQGKKKKKKLAF